MAQGLVLCNAQTRRLGMMIRTLLCQIQLCDCNIGVVSSNLTISLLVFRVRTDYSKTM